MELFDPKRLNFNFSRWFRSAAIFSVVVSVLSIIGFFAPGLNYGIDFRGGIEAAVEFKDANVSQKDLRANLEAKFDNLNIVNFQESGKSEFLITAQSADKTSVGQLLKSSLQEHYGAEGEAWTVKKLDVVGPKVGADLRKEALLALIYTCLLVTIYMYWRFDIRYSPGALAAIFHDLVFTTGFLVVTRGEFDTTVLAAFLTLAGYSINDTVVVYDRIREIEAKSPGRDRTAIVNEAINSTLSRTVMTAGATLMACVVLYVVGGPTLHAFAAALFFGILVGTYSSAFVAAPLYIWADGYFSAKTPAPVATKKA